MIAKGQEEGQQCIPHLLWMGVVGPSDTGMVLGPLTDSIALHELVIVLHIDIYLPLERICFRRAYD